jgi:hypothetical protein
MLTDALDDNDQIERSLGIGAGLAWRHAIDSSRGDAPRVLPVFYLDLGWSGGMRAAQALYDKEGISYEGRRLGGEWVTDVSEQLDALRPEDSK